MAKPIYRTLPGFDPTMIAFPTDAITIGQMRANEPGFLDDLNERPGNIAGMEPLATHHLELWLANKAYAAAGGLPEPMPQVDREETIELLDHAYVKFGLSTGMATTREMVRMVEQAAAAQAKGRAR